MRPGTPGEKPFRPSHTRMRPFAAALGAAAVLGSVSAAAIGGFLILARHAPAPYGAGEVPLAISPDRAAATSAPDTPAAPDVPAATADEDAEFEAPDAATLAGLMGPVEETQTLSMERGETLMQVLVGAGAAPQDTAAAIRALSSHYNPRRLRPDQAITVTLRKPRTPNALFDFLLNPLEREADRVVRILGLKIQTDVDRHVVVKQDGNGAFMGAEVVTPLTRELARARGAIESSLYGSARNTGVPDAVILDFIKLYTYSIDFQREIHPGDTFEVAYERFFDDKGQEVKTGSILFASLAHGKKARNLFRYKLSTGGTDYFDELGKSARKFLMRTPVDAVRISSRFGRRYHPIKKRWKRHNGVDFAAPTGTRIYAGGDGTVSYAGWARGYGRLVKIRHANGYETRYGHMSRFARGIRRGKRVRQGQLIGRVGATGWATGPHLHYEVRIHGKPKNPLRLRVPTGRNLAGKELERFKRTLDDTRAKLAAAPVIERVRTARLDKPDSGTP